MVARPYPAGHPPVGAVETARQPYPVAVPLSEPSAGTAQALRILVTGMSGTGKSSVLRALAHRGFDVVDTDEDRWNRWVATPDGQQEWIWHEAAIAQLLAEPRQRPLFVAGCRSNQGSFYPWFDQVVLLSAPVELMAQRIAARTDNPFGKDPEQWARVRRDLAEVEPLLRAGSSTEIVTTIPVAAVADRLVAVLGPSGQAPDGVR